MVISPQLTSENKCRRRW